MDETEAYQLAKVKECVRRRIAETAAIPAFRETAPRERTIAYSAVILQERIWSTLR